MADTIRKYPLGVVMVLVFIVLAILAVTSVVAPERLSGHSESIDCLIPDTDGTCLDDLPYGETPTPIPTPTPAPTIDPTGCIVNGFGNELCGESAAALCTLIYKQGHLGGDSLEACKSLGWRAPY